MSALGSILVAEDEADDVLLLKRAIARSGIANPFAFVPDGQEAIDYLAGTGRYTDRAAFPFPVLMMLDLKMPRVGGLEVLRWVRSQPGSLRRLPVIVLTSSRERPEVNLAFDLGANSYLVKPVGFDDLAATVKHLGLYWLLLNELPSASEDQP